MANSKKSRKAKTKQSTAPSYDVRIFATSTGDIIGQVHEEDALTYTLGYAFGLGVLENQAGIGFTPIKFYDPRTPLTVHKALGGLSFPAPQQIRDQYLKTLEELSPAPSQ